MSKDETGFVLDLRAEDEDASLRLLATAAVAALSEVVGCSVDCVVSLTGPGRAPRTEASSPAAAGLARLDQNEADGPTSQALAGRVAIIVNDFTRDARWPKYRAPLRAAGYRSVMAAPLPMEQENSAALTLLAEKPDVFTPAVLTDVMTFANAAGRSFTLATEIRRALTLAGQLREAMAHNISIDAACGVIMARNRCSHPEAMEIISTASAHRNIQARVVAETILKDLPGGAPTPPLPAVNPENLLVEGLNHGNT